MARLIDYQAAVDRYYTEFEKQDICDWEQDRDLLKQCFDESPPSTRCTRLARATAGSASTTIMAVALSKDTLAMTILFRCRKMGFAASASAGRIRSENFSSM